MLFFKILARVFLFASVSFFITPSFAAKVIDLKNTSTSLLNSYLVTDEQKPYQIKQTNESIDFNQTKHTRFQEFYAGYPIWGADFITHTPINKKTHIYSQEKTMNGIFYQELEKDLRVDSAYIFDTAQQDKAIKQAILTYQKQSGDRQIVSHKTCAKIIYIDNNKLAHWAYLISFESQQKNLPPKNPNFILDAITLRSYQVWDNTQTFSDSVGGGFGGNEKNGKITYDGLNSNYPQLNIQRDAIKNNCYLQNSEVTIHDFNTGNVSQFHCEQKDKQHNNIYWSADHDAVNGAYSPSNDALYIGKIVKAMYQQWYGIPVLTQNGKPMMLNMIVHMQMDNAYWNGRQMAFGDGISRFYPLVSLSVGAHEISHGFTFQHSGLAYFGQSGGLNESFSDMASQAALFYATKKNNWLIGDDIVKQKNTALRYMDEPTKDCAGKKPGDNCSINNIKNYYDGMEVHFSSGIFNKVFYLLGTSKDWDTKKAFDVMVHANQHYWTATTNFSDAACGVLKSAIDYKYSIDAAQNAMNAVGIDTKNC